MTNQRYRQTRAWWRTSVFCHVKIIFSRQIASSDWPIEISWPFDQSRLRDVTRQHEKLKWCRKMAASGKIVNIFLKPFLFILFVWYQRKEVLLYFFLSRTQEYCSSIYFLQNLKRSNICREKYFFIYPNRFFYRKCSFVF